MSLWIEWFCRIQHKHRTATIQAALTKTSTWVFLISPLHFDDTISTPANKHITKKYRRSPEPNDQIDRSWPIRTEMTFSSSTAPQTIDVFRFSHLCVSSTIVESKNINFRIYLQKHFGCSSTMTDLPDGVCESSEHMMESNVASVKWEPDDWLHFMWILSVFIRKTQHYGLFLTRVLFASKLEMKWKTTSSDVRFRWVEGSFCVERILVGRWWTRCIRMIQCKLEFRISRQSKNGDEIDKLQIESSAAKIQSKGSPNNYLQTHIAMQRRTQTELVEMSKLIIYDFWTSCPLLVCSLVCSFQDGWVPLQRLLENACVGWPTECDYLRLERKNRLGTNHWFQVHCTFLLFFRPLLVPFPPIGPAFSFRNQNITHSR